MSICCEMRVCVYLPPSLCISFSLSLQLLLSASCLTDILCQFPGPEAREQNCMSHFEQSNHAFTHTHTKTLDFFFIMMRTFNWLSFHFELMMFSILKLKTWQKPCCISTFSLRHYLACLLGCIVCLFLRKEKLQREV